VNTDRPAWHFWVDDLGRPFYGRASLPFRPTPEGLEFVIKEKWLKMQYGVSRIIVSWDELSKLEQDMRNGGGN
jgi:hypothetical protein